MGSERREILSVYLDGCERVTEILAIVPPEIFLKHSLSLVSFH